MMTVLNNGLPEEEQMKMGHKHLQSELNEKQNKHNKTTKVIKQSDHLFNI